MMKAAAHRTLLLVALAACASASADLLTKPQAPSTSQYRDLWQCADRELQSGLEKVLKDGGLLGDVRAHRLAVALVDITDARAPRVAAVNGDEMMYAASLPKIAILLGAFHKAEYDGATITPTLQRDIEAMIRVSDNAAATRVLHWVGPDYLIGLLQSPDLRLYDPAHNGGLWVGKDYGGAPAYERDPLHHLSHGATAMQVARFFFMLETQQLANGEYSERMKEALSNPGISHNFVKGLASRPDAVIYRKSGTWKQFHADGALIEAGNRRFILVGLAVDPRGGEWLASMAAPLYDLVVPRDFGIPTSFAGLRAANAPAAVAAPTRVASQSAH
jgi:beta-lactamase class A